MTVRAPSSQKWLAAWLPWLWVVWVIVLLVLVWRAFVTTGTPNAAPSTDRTLTNDEGSMPMTRAPLAEFGSFVVERSEVLHSDQSPASIADGIRKLTTVLIELALHENADGGGLWNRIDQLAVEAQLLHDDRLRSRHPRIARDAFTAAADVMATIQKAGYPHLGRAMAEARAAALSIRRDRPLLDQTDAVQRFFERSHDLLRAMTSEVSGTCDSDAC
jgi:hypothetical protein